MFRITKDAYLKKEILEYLDNQTDSVFFNEMLQYFPSISLTTLQKKCNEISQIIQIAYPENEVELVINKRTGIRLIRHAENLETVIEHLITAELAYQLARRFAYQTSIDSESFCQEMEISFSQLRRKITLINQSINRYDLHITVSHQIKIFGSELMRRANLIFALSTAHRVFSTIYWIENPNRYLKQSELILDYLKLSKTYASIEKFALIIFVVECAINNGCQIHFHKSLTQLVDNTHFPTKPSFLFNWTNNDWYFFILMIYCSADSNYSLDICPTIKGLIVQDPLITQWISIFEKHFNPLDDTKKEIITEELIRGYVTDSFLNMDYVFWDIRSMDFLDRQKKQYPVFHKKFLTFWQEFATSRVIIPTDYLKFRSLLISQLVLPLQESIPKIYLYNENNLMLAMESMMKNRIVTHFRNYYEVIFTDQVTDADFIISTSKNYPYTKELSQKILLIEPILSKNDLTYMHKRFAAFFD